MSIYISSDFHFSHDNIIRYTKRPFKSSHEMNKALQENWNNVATKEDTVYVLGDFSLSKETNLFENILNKLNGNKILILGNHDKLTPWQYLEVGFAAVHTSLVISHENREYFLCHDPATVSCVDYRYNLVGHVHGLWDSVVSKKGQLLINVGVDVRGFKPISIEEIGKIVEEFEEKK